VGDPTVISPRSFTSENVHWLLCGVVYVMICLAVLMKILTCNRRTDGHRPSHLTVSR